MKTVHVSISVTGAKPFGWRGRRHAWRTLCSVTESHGRKPTIITGTDQVTVSFAGGSYADHVDLPTAKTSAVGDGCDDRLTRLDASVLAGEADLLGVGVLALQAELGPGRVDQLHLLVLGLGRLRSTALPFATLPISARVSVAGPGVPLLSPPSSIIVAMTMKPAASPAPVIISMGDSNA